MVISVPEITNRYYSFQLVDLYTFNFGYFGTRTNWGAGHYLIAGPAWKGSVPAGINAAFRSEGNFVYALGRTEVKGETDVTNVLAIQAQYQVQPLSQFLGQLSPPPAVLRPPYSEFPAFDTNRADSVEFITYFNFLLDQLSIYPTEKTMIASFARIGVGPGRPFNSAWLRPDVKNAIESGVASALQEIEDKAKTLGMPTNGWRLPGDIFGSREKMAQIPDEYLVRAAAAYLGLYGNDLEEAYYPSTYLDGSYASLDASTNSYVLHFQPEEIPPVDTNGFWSITMYGPNQFLVTNSINRYSVGSLTGLTNDVDGSLTIYIGTNAPPNAPLSNWLPAPASTFSLTLRMYLPQPSAVAPPYYAPPPISNLNQP